MQDSEQIELDNFSLKEIEQLILSTLLLIKKELLTKQTLQSRSNTERLFATAVSMSKACNDVSAAKFMRFAAMQGHVKAQFYLGMMFAKGQGLPQSPFHAYTWLSLAESQGSIEAVEAIGKLQGHLQAKQIRDAKSQAADLYEKINDNIALNELIE